MLGKRSSIMIFIRDLPGSLTPKELKAFVLAGVQAARARSAAIRGTVASCTILRMSDPKSGVEEYHGLVEVQPAKAAIHAISELNGRELRGRKLEVHRYHPRSALRGRTFQSMTTTSPEAGDSGEADRRRNLKIDLVNT
jgi:hypothetical protein